MIEGQVVGGTELVQRIGAFGPKIQGGLEKAIRRLTIELLAQVKAQKLSGQVLNVKTGRLRRSITQRIDGAGSASVTGTVGTNVAYGKVHEFGGPQTIRAHQRMMTKAWGKPVKEPRLISVRAHIAKYPERSFLRSALADLEPKIKATLQGAVTEAVK